MTDPDTVLRDALALHQGGDLAPACGLYQLVLLLRPNDHVALHLLGVARAAQGAVAEGIGLIRRALILHPAFPMARFNLGCLLLGQKAFAEAADALRTAVALQPDNRDGWLNLANSLQSLGQTDQALAALDRALALDPSFLPGRAMRGIMRNAVGQHAGALTDLSAVLAVLPDEPITLSVRGGAYWMLDDMAAAVRDLDRALALDPANVTALINRANVYQDELRYDDALALYDRALTVDSTALENRGSVLQAMGRLEEALDSFRRAEQVRPDRPDTACNIALCLLQQGRWRDGWRAYDARLRRPPWSGAMPAFGAPPWDGTSDLAGKRVLLAAEQGLGDTIQFCRYASLAAARGATVLLGVEPPLRRLMQGLSGVAEVVTPEDPEPGWDVFLPLMSAPDRLGVPEPFFPGPYLAADPDAVAAWRARVDALRGLKVGLVWAGASHTVNDRTAQRMDRRRSMPAERLGPLLDVAGVTFVSLQKGATSVPPGVVDWTDELGDFADTAALIAALDLVIGVDTSVVHAAGAMGRPVWVLNRFDRCWRWMLGRDDTAWYPSMRLFTQPSPGDWDAVVAEAAAALRGLSRPGRRRVLGKAMIRRLAVRLPLPESLPQRYDPAREAG